MKRRNRIKKVFVSYAFQTHSGQMGEGYKVLDLKKRSVITEGDLRDLYTLIKKNTNAKEVIIKNYKFM